LKTKKRLEGGGRCPRDGHTKIGGNGWFSLVARPFFFLLNVSLLRKRKGRKRKGEVLHKRGRLKLARGGVFRGFSLLVLFKRGLLF